MNLKLCYITGWSLLVATGLSAQNRGDLAVKVARDSGQVIELTLQENSARTFFTASIPSKSRFLPSGNGERIFYSWPGIFSTAIAINTKKKLPALHETPNKNCSNTIGRVM